MLNKALDDIQIEDFLGLRDTERPESLTLEYKQHWPATDPAKGAKEAWRDLLSEIAALASQRGGDLVIGIEEDEDRNPARVPGVTLQKSVHDEKQRLQNKVEIEIEPRPNFDCRFIEGEKDRYIVLVRIYPDWLPHKIKNRGFYDRGPSGKIPMSWLNIRDAFLKYDGAIERQIAWRRNRCSDFRFFHDRYSVARDFPLFLIHSVPLFTAGAALPIDKYLAGKTRLKPPLGGPINKSVNAEGPIWINGKTRDPEWKDSGEPFTRSYVQVFRNGIVEAGVSLSPMKMGKPVFFGTWIAGNSEGKEEGPLRSSLREYLAAQDELGAPYPRLVSVSFVFPLRTPLLFSTTDNLGEADQKTVYADRILPEQALEKSNEEDITQVLDDIEELIWNGFNLVHDRQNARGMRKLPRQVDISKVDIPAVLA